MLTNTRRIAIIAFIVLVGLSIFSNSAESAPFPKPFFQIGVGDAETPEDLAVSLQIIALLTILALAPSILIMMTCFTRIIVVFHFLKQALGLQGVPPNQVVAGLSLFMTFFIMAPVWNQVYDQALNPYLNNEINYQDAFEKAQIPIKNFMLANTREKDLALFVKASKFGRPKNKDDVHMLVLIPAFVISELKTAFIIGFLLYVPFIIIDMVVASVLLAMGMMMLPPVMISIPFKLILFVLVDGWSLIVDSLIRSFGVS